jgi:DNA-binding NarL/FixJ family response regulator
MDIRLGPASGIECTRRLRAALPDLKLLLISGFLEPALALEGLMAGASGYLLKPFGRDELHQALSLILAGGVYLSAPVQKVLAQGLRAMAAALDGPLSARERQVALRVCSGSSPKDVARQLDLATETVQTHLKRVYRKLGVHDRHALVQRMLHHG